MATFNFNNMTGTEPSFFSHSVRESGTGRYFFPKGTKCRIVYYERTSIGMMYTQIPERHPATQLSRDMYLDELTIQHTRGSDEYQEVIEAHKCSSFWVITNQDSTKIFVYWYLGILKDQS